MKRVAIAVGLVGAAIAVAPARAAAERPLIQIALLLDTSNSMDGLIDQARTQMWRVVNEFATAKKGGVRPALQVALYEYGNDSIPAGEGHVRLVLPLTTDLDSVSEKLFALRTNGGDEYCGRVIGAATAGLAWSASNGDFKAIFIAGNEPFTQGDVDYRKSCKAAITKGIVVDTVFCGNEKEGISTNWKDGADLADGRYMNIDQNAATVTVAAPQDAKIAELGTALNHTYIPYGAQGAAGGARQAEQDTNAKAAAPAAYAQRQAAKASELYTNSSWDLVDAEKEGKAKIETMKTEELPVEMQKMTAPERQAYVQAKAKEREKVQAEIKKLSDERQKYVAEEMKKRAASGQNTLDAAIIKAVRDEAAKKSFQFE